MPTFEEEILYRALFIITTFLVLLLSVFVINLIMNQKRMKSIQLALISSEILTLENERKRISQDLHDGVGMAISTALLYNGMIKSTDIDDQNNRHKIQDILNNTLEQIRFISHNITPRHIEQEGLELALEEMVLSLNLALQGNPHIAIDQIKLEDSLTEMEMINLYRISYEAIHNAIKHAESTVINLSIRSNSKKLILVISDNGKGFRFSYDNYSMHRNGIGLKNIQNRATLLGGKLSVFSQVGNGTQVIVEISK